jgi:tRNA-specific 2-thiouridylase
MIAIGMSGGVDSSLAAALLAEAGHQVLGITLRLWDGPRGPDSCCKPCEVDDAKAVAAITGIRHHVIDAAAQFRAAVVEGFLDAYAAGTTPNPCVRCNERIKFGVLWQQVRALGATRLATGHYARIAQVDGRLVPRRAVDRNKDQTAFLFSLSQEQLACVEFPLGGMDKESVRRAAEERHLPTARKRESMDVCFVAGDGITGLMERERPGVVRPGPILTRDGRQLGYHAGLAGYTIGQRKGLGIAAAEPLFVIALDAAQNAVIVGPKAALMTDRLRLDACTWHLDPPSQVGLRVLARPRHRSPGLPATVVPEGDGFCVRFDAPIVRPAVGQACVCYDPADDLCLGGGWIAA